MEKSSKETAWLVRLMDERTLENEEGEILSSVLAEIPICLQTLVSKNHNQRTI